MSNKTTWTESDVVEYYTNDTRLQAPEKTIIELLKDKLPEMKMLDIGVGGGRTAAHFSNLVKTYDGIDYSEDMIAICNKQFSDKNDPINFNVCDARDMGVFEDNNFDFILFSYNGIDYISHQDRLKVFKEIIRVGKPGAIFCFSTHNLDSVQLGIDLKSLISLNPKTIVRNLRHWFLFRFIYNRGLNHNKLKNAKYLIFNDGGHEYRLKTYYIRPVEQISQLIETGFSDSIDVFSLNTGDKINNLDNLNDDWLYYLCRLK